MEGFQNKQFKISQALTHSKMRSQSSGNKIWIRPEPIFDKKTHKYLFFLGTKLI